MVLHNRSLDYPTSKITKNDYEATIMDHVPKLSNLVYLKLDTQTRSKGSA